MFLIKVLKLLRSFFGEELNEVFEEYIAIFGDGEVFEKELLIGLY